MLGALASCQLLVNDVGGRCRNGQGSDEEHHGQEIGHVSQGWCLETLVKEHAFYSV